MLRVGCFTICVQSASASLKINVERGQCPCHVSVVPRPWTNYPIKCYISRFYLSLSLPSTLPHIPACRSSDNQHLRPPLQRAVSPPHYTVGWRGTRLSAGLASGWCGRTSRCTWPEEGGGRRATKSKCRGAGCGGQRATRTLALESARVAAARRRRCCCWWWRRALGRHQRHDDRCTHHRGHAADQRGGRARLPLRPYRSSKAVRVWTQLGRCWTHLGRWRCTCPPLAPTPGKLPPSAHVQLTAEKGSGRSHHNLAPLHHARARYGANGMGGNVVGVMVSSEWW